MAMCTEQIAKLEEGTQGIACKLSFLLGVRQECVQNDSTQLACYQKLENNKHARIVRNLSILRTDIMRNWDQIAVKIKTEGQFLLAMKELISPQAITVLNSDRIEWYKRSKSRLEDHVIEINRLLSDRINNLRDIFPLWLDWAYIRSLFIMPNGFSRASVAAEVRKYHSKINLYPY